jgi:hypothetical protein
MSIEFKGEGYHAKKPQKKDLVILDQKEQTDAKPRHSNVDREARLSVINNRMFIISILIVLVKFFAIYAQHAASVRGDNTIKTAGSKCIPMEPGMLSLTTRSASLISSRQL